MMWKRERDKGDVVTGLWDSGARTGSDRTRRQLLAMVPGTSHALQRM